MVCLLQAGCGRPTATSEPDAIHSEAELTQATLRLEVESCGTTIRQFATAAVLEAAPLMSDANVDPAIDPAVDRPTRVATVAHPFLVDGELAARSFTVYDADGRELGAHLTFIDPATDVALLSLSDPRPGLTTAMFAGPDQTSRVVRYQEGETAPMVAGIAVVRETTATLDGVGPRQALELTGSIKSGDSGAPVIDDQGQVIGLVFATSRSSKTSWAIAAPEFEAAMAQPTEPVELTCE